MKKITKGVIKKNNGFSLVEVILTSFLFAMIVTAFTGSYLYGNESTALSATRAQAVYFAEEGVEAVKNIRDDDFANLLAGTYGLAVSGNQWTLSGTSDTEGIFTRNVTITDVSTTERQVTVNVAWQQTAQRTGLISLVTNLTNWSRSVSQSANDFVVNVTNASIGGGGNKELKGVTISNIGAVDLIIDTITVTWGNTREIEEIKIDKEKSWKHNKEGSPDGRQPSGTVIDIVDFTLNAGANDIPIDKFKFNGDMQDETFTILFTLTNGDTIEAIVDFNVEPPPPPDWVFPRLEGIYNTSSASPGKDVLVFGTTAYFITKDKGNDLYVVDTTNHITPTLTSSLSLGKGAERMDISGGYAFIASKEDGEELQVIDLGTMSQVGDYNKTGNADAKDVAVSGNTAFLVTKNVGGNPGYELYSLDISTPSNPTLIGGLNIGKNTNGITVSGNYAYIVTDEDNAEFQIIDISSPSSPTLVSTLDLPDKSNGRSVFIEGTTAYVGQDNTKGGGGEFFIIDIIDPAVPVVMNGNGFEVGEKVNGIFVTGNQAFLATANKNDEFQVLNVTTSSTPSLTGSLNLAGKATSVVVVDNTAFVTTENRNQEFIIIEPY